MNEQFVRTVWILFHFTNLIILYLTPKFQLDQIIGLLLIFKRELDSLSTASLSTAGLSTAGLSTWPFYRQPVYRQTVLLTDRFIDRPFYRRPVYRQTVLSIRPFYRQVHFIDNSIFINYFTLAWVKIIFWNFVYRSILSPQFEYKRIFCRSQVVFEIID